MRSRRPGKNSHTHAAQVAGALIALGNGTCKTKHDAAQFSGTSAASLSPARLAALIAASPQLRHIFRANALDITAEITKADGSKARVSMRDALSEGATNCVRILAELAPKLGKLTREENESYRQAERWLRMCTQIGLFAANEGASLPGELAQADHDPAGSLEWYLQDMRRQGVSPGLLTVIPAEEANPPDGEGVAGAGNVVG